jgi:hypothetical protein
MLAEYEADQSTAHQEEERAGPTTRSAEYLRCEGLQAESDRFFENLPVRLGLGIALLVGISVLVQFVGWTTWFGIYIVCATTIIGALFVGSGVVLRLKVVASRQALDRHWRGLS